MCLPQECKAVYSASLAGTKAMIVMERGGEGGGCSADLYTCNDSAFVSRVLSAHTWRWLYGDSKPPPATPAELLRRVMPSKLQLLY